MGWVLIHTAALGLRPGCGWLRTCFRVQTIDEVDISMWDQVDVFVSGDLNGAVSHLVAHVRERRASLNEQAAEGVAEIVKTEAT